MRFRKIFLLMILAVCLIAHGSFAFAEEEVKVEVIGTEPAELTEAGTVTVTFEISNHSDYELSNLSIVQGEYIYKIPEETIIPVAGSAKIPVAVSVTDAQIGLPLTFMVSWHCGGEPYFLNKEVTVERAVEPTISMTRNISDTHARTGEKLTLTYTLKNETKFDMTDIMLIDEQISDNPIRRNDTLRANDSFLIEYTYTMGSSDVVSAPVVTYVVNGKTKSFSSVEPVTLSMVNIDIRLDVERGTPSATGVPFTLTAKNQGNQKVTDLVIKDEQGNLVNNTPFSLDPGGSQTLSHTVAPVMGDSLRNVSFTLYGTDDFGDPCNSETTAVFPIYPFVDDSQIQVGIQGQVTTEWTAQTGTVAVRLQIQNNSSVTLTNAVLSETSLGVLQTYATLSNGQTIYEAELMIGSPRNLSFTLQATDPAGTDRTAADFLLTVAYPDTTEAPEAPTETPQQLAPSSGIWSNLITRVLIILGAIMIIAFAILLILTILERSHRIDGMSLFEEEDGEEGDDFDDMYDSVETVYENDDVPLDEYGTPLTPDYLHRAKLYVPKSDTYGNSYGADTNVPSYDDIMQSTASIRRQNDTQRIPVRYQTDTFRRPRTEIEVSRNDYVEVQAPYQHEYEHRQDHSVRLYPTFEQTSVYPEAENAAEDDFFTADDYLATADVDDKPIMIDPYTTSFDRPLQKAEIEQTVPKTIPVHRMPRTQTQRRNAVKRVTTTHDQEE